MPHNNADDIEQFVDDVLQEFRDEINEQPGFATKIGWEAEHERQAERQAAARKQLLDRFAQVERDFIDHLPADSMRCTCITCRVIREQIAILTEQSNEGEK